MTIPANLNLEGSPYGAQPVVPLIGPQGGPYNVRGPLLLSLFPLAVRASGGNSAVQMNNGYRGAIFRFNVTVNPGAGATLAPTIFGFDAALGAAYVLLSVAASVTPGGIYMLYPGLSGAAVEGVSQTRNLVLPDQFYCNMGHVGAGSWTYAVSAVLLP